MFADWLLNFSREQSVTNISIVQQYSSFYITLEVHQTFESYKPASKTWEYFDKYYL